MAAADARGISLDVAKQLARRVGELAVALEHQPPLHEVGGRVEEHAFRLESVTAGTAGFLLIVLERLRCAGVHDEADVGPIDAHAERDRRDDESAPFVEERGLVAAALGVGEPGVIRQGAHTALAQPRRERVDLAARRAVDDPRLAAVAGEDVEQLPLQSRARQHAVDRFGRSNEPTSSSGLRSPSCAAMSWRTRAVAVAV